jgi:DNA-binding GntR family transcriptional regulator
MDIGDTPTEAGETRKGDIPLRQAAYESIENLLKTGLLRPGQIVSQRELVKSTGLTLGAMRDAYQFRLVIELFAVPFTVQRMPDDEIDDLIRWHLDLRTRAAQGADGERVAAEIQQRDWVMHESFVMTTGNRLMSNIFRVTSIKIRMAVQSRIRVTSYSALRVIDEHLAILEPLRRRDADGMAAGLTRHIDNSLMIALGGNV